MSTVIVLGDAGLDVVARHGEPITYGGDIRASIETTAGGAGANTAVWLAGYGAKPVLVTRVGDDSAGRQTATELTSKGVRCAFTVDPAARTFCVVVLVDSTGQRTMLPDRGAAARVHPDDLDTRLLAEARHLHLSGYLLLDESSRAAGVAALTAARDAGLTTSVDPQAAALLLGGGRERFLEAVRGVDLLLPNADELSALTGSPAPLTDGSARGLLDVVGAVVATDGPGMAVWLSAEGELTMPAPEVRCVDSTGAGDAFNAGLLCAWLSGASRSTALRAGVRAGADAVQYVGAQPPRC
ncbi:sugar kinase [Pseudonocardiaceae bacterium YIM PH 21723]|nr:sugar kinase [Pseudonocardiaceae bacterium YIM PH 21723]